jgi:hypothetical protein
MLLELHHENLMIPTSLRILGLLDRPEASEPEFEPQIRRAIASLIRRSFQTGFHEADLTPDITPDAVLALDACYGWLSDFAAYRRDFRGDSALQHAMTVRAFGWVQKPAIPVVPSRYGVLWD